MFMSSLVIQWLNDVKKMFLALRLPQVVMGRGAHITPSHTHRERRGDTEGERDLAEKLFTVTETG